MESSSPQRTSEPLLRDESVDAPRMGAYAPPANNAVQAPYGNLQPVVAAGVATSDPYDLHLVATNQDGEVLNPSVETNGVYVNPPVPPLVSYCSYVRVGFAFGKWLIFWGIINAVAMAICFKSGYFDWNALWPFDSWKGLMLSGTWFVTAVFFGIAAKRIERDVQHIDHISQYEQGRTTEDQHSSNGNSTESNSFVPNFDHIYGQMSRKLDTFFSNKVSSEAGHHAPVGGHFEGASSLVNISYVLAAVGLAASVFLGTGSMLGRGYTKSCDPSNLPAANSTSGNGSPKDFQDISEFPTDVQEWIADQRDPWGGGRLIGFDDDYYNGGDENLPDAYSFPIAHEREQGVFAAMSDGTLFFAALPPPTKTEDGTGYITSSHMVLIESASSSASHIEYHDDIINPRMFIPVENTIDTDSNGNRIATQYCFTASKDPSEKKKKKQRRSWDAMIRTTDIHCIFKKTGDNGVEFEFKKTTIAWSDKTRRGPDLVAASSGGSILIAHVGEDDFHVYQEVVSINPNSMSKKIVFHQTRSEGDFYGYGGNDHPFTRCVQDSVFVFGAIAGICCMVASGLWLILREGVPSGVAPIILAIVATTRTLTGPYGFGITSLILTAGTVFFHVVLCCGGGSSSMIPLPAWIGRDIYIWALYSWMLSFLLIYTLFGFGESTILSLVYLGLSGIVLDHPVAYVMGICSIAMGFVSMLFIPFFGYSDDFFDSILFIVIGFGIMGVASFISNHRNFCTVFCMPITRAFRVMFYGNAGNLGNAAPVSTGRPQSMAAPVTSGV